jgi:hypothetical protein
MQPMESENRMLGKQIRYSVLVSAMLICGCVPAPTTQPLTQDQQQDEILKQMDYKPSTDHDIAGGDITHVGKGIDKDMNDVLNP